jgi:hypothetical protein
MLVHSIRTWAIRASNCTYNCMAAVSPFVGNFVSLRKTQSCPVLVRYTACVQWWPVSSCLMTSPAAMGLEAQDTPAQMMLRTEKIAAKVTCRSIAQERLHMPPWSFCLLGAKVYYLVSLARPLCIVLSEGHTCVTALRRLYGRMHPPTPAPAPAQPATPCPRTDLDWGLPVPFCKAGWPLHGPGL